MTVACPDSWKRLDKPPTVAVWVDPQVVMPAVEEVAPLTINGELFVEYGRLEWDGGQPRVVVGERLNLPPRTPVTLVIYGDWPGALDGQEAAGKALGEVLEGLALQGESRGLKVLGLHLEILDVQDLESFATVLSAAQGELAPELFLSVSLPRQWFGDENLRQIADAVDFFVPLLYGQRPGASIWDPAWTLSHVVEEARQVDALGRDFLVGVSVVGTAIFDPKAGVSGVRTRGTLRELALSPGLELVPGFSLSGIDGRRYTFRALGGVRFAGERLSLGQTLDVVGLGLINLEDYHAAMAAAGFAHYRGEVFYRLLAPEERFLLSRQQLPPILRREKPRPEMIVEVLPQDSRGGRHRFQVAVVNTGQQATEIASIDHNFLELTALDAYFSDADRGQFQRYQLLSRGGDGQVRATLRQARVLRFFRPILDLGDRVTSGSIRITAAGSDPRVRVGGSFLLPDGEIFTIPAQEWRP